HRRPRQCPLRADDQGPPLPSRPEPGGVDQDARLQKAVLAGAGTPGPTCGRGCRIHVIRLRAPTREGPMMRSLVRASLSSRGCIVAGAVMAVLFLVPAGARARHRMALPCPVGQFDVAGAALMDSTATDDAIVIRNDRHLTVSSGCGTTPFSLHR